MSAEVAGASANAALGTVALKSALDTQKTQTEAITKDLAEGTEQIQASAQKAEVPGGGANVDIDA